MSNLHELMQQLSLDNGNTQVKINNGVNASHLNDGFDTHPSVSSRELILLNANVEQGLLLELLQRCGEVKHLAKSNDMPQAWYAIYYDVRAAQIALSTYQGRSIDGVQAPLEVHSKASWVDKEGLGEDCLIVANIDDTASVDEVKQIFSRFGDIADIMILPGNRRAVQFFDIRSCDAAYRQLMPSGVVQKPVPPMGAPTANMLQTNISPSDSASSFGGLPFQAAGGNAMPSANMQMNPNLLMNMLPNSGSVPNMQSLASGGMSPAVSASNLDPNALMNNIASSQALSQLGLLHQNQVMPGQLQKIASAQNLASLGLGAPTMSSPAELIALQQQNNQIQQLAQMMAAMQAQSLISAAQGILKSASLNNLDLSKLAQQQAEAMRRAEMARKYALDVEKIQAGEDQRTTLMLKNIPNKYSPQMLLDTINEAGVGGRYDFLYLPIDFRNRCNVGYAFINMRNSVTDVPLLFQVFNGRRWERFNSEKVAQVAYARIQGRAQLIQHFQNSSLMLEDESCRPMLFKDNGEAEEFPVGPNVRPRVPGSSAGDSSTDREDSGSEEQTNE
eukprot:TRINITY_DN1503_c2_g4_i1.p1 TRINITY_DN1503_c2_g4~~TRINITY_DN1503_c2_g4_i1.p1  ORF type:complete len:605 (-),score=78.98 TRINITY_DN1503_c2_g4_i1:880-2559(-)